MKSKLYILLIIFLPLLTFSQTREVRPKYAPRKEKHRNATDSRGKQGTWKFYTQNKELFLELNYENDMKNGPCTRYYTSIGSVKEETNYYYGVLEGEYKSYHTSGATRAEGQFVKNRRDGHWTFYYGSTGEKSTEGDYMNGKKNGEWLYYNRKGEMSARGEYKNDSRTGIWRYYNGEGKEIRTENYSAKPKPVAEKKESKPSNSPKIISSKPVLNKSKVLGDNPKLISKPQINYTPTEQANTEQNQQNKTSINPQTGNETKNDSVTTSSEDKSKSVNARINITPSK